MNEKRILFIAILFVITIAACFMFDSELAGGLSGVALATGAAGAVGIPEKKDGEETPTKKVEDVKIPKKEISENDIQQMIDEKMSKMDEKIAGVISTQNMPKEEFHDPANEKDDMVKRGREFIKAVVRNNPEMLPEEYRTKTNWLNEGTNSEGLYTVPPEYYNQIMENVVEVSVIKNHAMIIESERKELLVPKLSTTPTFTFVTEGNKKQISNPSFGQVALARKDGGFIILLSKQLVEDSMFDVMGFVSKISAKVIGQAIDTAGFKGLGSIKGLLDLLTPCTEVETGVALANVTYDNILDMITAIPANELPNAKWFMHRTIWGMLKKLKYIADGKFVISPEDKKSMTIENFPVVLSDQTNGIADDGSDKRFVVFGDLINMILMMRHEITVSVSDQASVEYGGTQINLWQQGLIGLNFGVSFDINYTFPEAISVLRTVSD